MDLQDLKTEVNFINQNSTRKSFEILIKLLEKTGFVTALKDAEMSKKMADQFEKTMAEEPTAQPKTEQEDMDAQLQDGEEIPDAEVVDQSEVGMADVEEEPAPVDAEPIFTHEDPNLRKTEGVDVQEDTREPAAEEAPEPDGEWRSTDDQKVDVEPTTGDGMEKVTITSDDVGEVPAAVFTNES